MANVPSTYSPYRGSEAILRQVEATFPGIRCKKAFEFGRPHARRLIAVLHGTSRDLLRHGFFTRAQLDRVGPGGSLAMPLDVRGREQDHWDSYIRIVRRKHLDRCLVEIEYSDSDGMRPKILHALGLRTAAPGGPWLRLVVDNTRGAL